MAELAGAVGIFDSGLGGLTALLAMEELCPEADIIYFGDTARVPYGSREDPELRVFARQNLQLLQCRGAAGAIAACGTISSLLSRAPLERPPLPVTGITRAAAAAAVGTGARRIGVLATAATVRNRGFLAEIQQLEPGARVFFSACPGFVPLAEAGVNDPEHPELKRAVEQYLPPLLEQRPEAIILGCTHYPLLREAIERLTGDIPLIDAGREAAAEYCRRVKPRGSGRRQYLVSGDPQGFCAAAEKLLGRRMPLPERADPGKAERG